MKAVVDIRVNPLLVQALRDLVREVRAQMGRELALDVGSPEPEDRELDEAWRDGLREALDQDVECLLELIGQRDFGQKPVTLAEEDCEPVLRGCSALRLRIRETLFKDLPEEAREEFRRLCEELEGKADRALETIEAGLEDAIQVLMLPHKYRRRLKSTNMLERLIEEVRRRERVIRIFPNERSAWRLLGALLAEQHEVWSTGRKWLDMELYWDWKAAQELRPAA